MIDNTYGKSLVMTLLCQLARAQAWFDLSLSVWSSTFSYIMIGSSIRLHELSLLSISLYEHIWQHRDGKRLNSTFSFPTAKGHDVIGLMTLHPDEERWEGEVSQWWPFSPKRDKCLHGKLDRKIFAAWLRRHESGWKDDQETRKKMWI